MTRTNVDYLIMAQTSYDSSVRYPGIGDPSRYAEIISEIKSRMTEDELLEYDRRINFVESAEVKAKRLKTELYAMEMNRDSQSI